MKKILLAFQFLTIVPLKAKSAVTEGDIVRSSSAFVIVGIIQGLVLVIANFASEILFHPELVIGIVLLVYVISSGGFHLDGLADTADALAVKANGDRVEVRNRRLAVMKDSATGPIGVITIVFMILLKYLALKNISHLLVLTYYSSLLFMPAISKWAMVMAIFHGKPAREDGLGKIFVNRIGFQEVFISTLIVVIPLLALPVFFIQYISSRWYIFYALLLVTIYIFCRGCIIFFNRKFGGLTGDTLGAISELTEMIFLFMVIGWSRLYI